MELIEAGAEYIPVIRSISSRVWPETFSPILSPEQIRYMMEMMYSTESLARQMTEPGLRYFLARHEGEYVGYLSTQTDYRGTNRTKIHKIYVLPETQGCGCGKFLIRKAEEVARKAGNDLLTLHVNRNNPAIGFYERLGFVVQKEEDTDIGGGFMMRDYVMIKPIG